jgi:hypothetical protein
MPLGRRFADRFGQLAAFLLIVLGILVGYVLVAVESLDRQRHTLRDLDATRRLPPQVPHKR